MSFPLPGEVYAHLPRHPGWKFEHIGGRLLLSPHARTLWLRRSTAQPVTQARAGIEVRALDVAADGEAVAALLGDVWSHEDPYRHYDDRGESLQSEIERSLRTVRFGAVIPFAGTVRAAALVHEEHDRPTLTWLTVGARERERGVATGLLGFINTALREQGESELASGATAANLASLRWHLSRGFVLAPDPLREVPLTR